MAVPDEMMEALNEMNEVEQDAGFEATLKRLDVFQHAATLVNTVSQSVCAWDAAAVHVILGLVAEHFKIRSCQTGQGSEACTVAKGRRQQKNRALIGPRQLDGGGAGLLFLSLG